MHFNRTYCVHDPNVWRTLCAETKIGCERDFQLKHHCKILQTKTMWDMHSRSTIQSLSCHPRIHPIFFVVANLQGTSIMAPLRTKQRILKMESIELYVLSATASQRYSGIPISCTHIYAQKHKGNRANGEYLCVEIRRRKNPWTNTCHTKERKQAIPNG